MEEGQRLIWLYRQHNDPPWAYSAGSIRIIQTRIIQTRIICTHIIHTRIICTHIIHKRIIQTHIYTYRQHIDAPWAYSAGSIHNTRVYTTHMYTVHCTHVHITQMYKAQLPQIKTIHITPWPCHGSIRLGRLCARDWI